MGDEFGSVPRTILWHECTEQTSPRMTTKNSQYSIYTQILLNKALDDQKYQQIEICVILDHMNM